MTARLNAVQHDKTPEGFTELGYTCAADIGIRC